MRRVHSGWKTLLNANATRHRNAFHHVKRKKGDKTSPRCHCKSGVTLYSPTSLQVFSFFLQSFRVSETSWRLATLWSVAACVERCHTCRRVTIRSKIKVQKKETVTNEMWYTYICIYIYLLFFFAPKQHKHSQLTNETNACVKWLVNTVVWRRKEELTRVRITGFTQKSPSESLIFKRAEHFSVMRFLRRDITDQKKKEKKIEDRRSRTQWVEMKKRHQSFFTV